VNVVKEATRAELDHRLQRMGSSMGRHSADWSRRSAEGVLNQQDQVRPISLFEKELPSRNFSNQLDVRPLANVERHDSARPLLHGSSDKKTNGELDYLMAEYAGTLSLFFFFFPSLWVHVDFCKCVSQSCRIDFKFGLEFNLILCGAGIGILILVKATIR